MSKRKDEIEYINVDDLPKSCLTKFQKLDGVCNDFQKMEHLCELSPSGIERLNANIKNKTIYFDYDYILYTTEHQLHKEKIINMNIDFSKQVHINEKMFTILLNWISEVHTKFKTSPETLYLTHQVISRYLTMEHNIRRNKLQLVGIASFYMCSKYEDEYPPEIRDMIFICDNAYSKQEIIDMEWNILSKFNFNLLYTPTIYTFNSLFSFFGLFEKKVVVCMMYLCNIYTLYTDFLQYNLSKIVSSTVAIAQDYTGCSDDNIFSREMVFCSGYILDDLKDCIKTFYKIFSIKDNFDPQKNAIYKRYSGEKFQCIATEFEKYDWKRVI
jgi:cyclin B